ncbi:hypothetical protein ACKI1I_02440 [Streptomyces turgidiscabies]|uniref:Tat pathway signal sequence domain protein n=1 Tax=Streptomyces turgidiscabies (strain Car8) TaxID=698760 RepID=L7FIW6_STRT8|nr:MULTISPECIES: hypothetical protein [Streptomyces]ELP71333.1 Tat pathway signal sequence domain protein [Streptomyces turgidiscabies Car8]MDX3492244.1 hypothetical protein [Streptomyces turgidiscabies]GAQ69465.1 hypothetical protein T45_01190 [Streptomyces turgidiscabies]
MTHRLRSALSAVLIALACFLLPFGALSAWAAYGLADTDRYVTTMAPLAQNPYVQDAIADNVGAGIVHAVDVGPLEGTVNHFVQDAVHSFTRTEAFRTAWDTANRATHEAVLRALRNDPDRQRPYGRYGGEAAVTIDLAPVTAQVKRQLTVDHVPLASRIPVAHTEVAVLPAQDLVPLRKGFRVLEVAGFWLPVAAGVLAVAGIALAVRRRRAITATALGTALGGALLGVALAVARRLTLTDLPPGVSAPAAGAVYDALTATLRTVSWLLLALGLVVALGMWITQRYAPAARSRRASAPPVPTPLPEPTQAQV